MAEKELELLENVELRLALIDSNEKLTRALNTFLVPILLKLDSPHDTVRKKVFSICSHINKRVKPAPDVILPVAGLIQILTTPTSGSLVQSFSLIYIEMGYPRIPFEEAFHLSPKLVHGISKRSIQQQILIFQVLLPVFAGFQKFIEKNPLAKDPFDFKSHPEDLAFLLIKFSDVALYLIPVAEQSSKSTPSHTPSTTSPASSEPKPVRTPSGLSRVALDFITNGGKAPWSTSNSTIKEYKISLAKFVINEAMVPTSLCVLQKFLLYLICASDPYHEVQSIGEDGLRRQAKPDFEDLVVTTALYDLYLGDRNSFFPGFSIRDDTRTAASTSLKQLIIQYLSKSICGANQWTECHTVVGDAVFGAHNVPRLRSAGMGFVQWIARQMADDGLQRIGKHLMEGMISYVHENSGNADSQEQVMLSSAYESIGLLAKRDPSLCKNNFQLLKTFFKNLPKEAPSVRMSLSNALTSMIPAFKESIQDAEMKEKMEELLLSKSDHEEHFVRYAAIRYAVEVFPFQSAFARYLCLLALADPKLEIKEEAKRGLSFPPLPDLSINETEDQTICEKWKKQLPTVSDMAAFLKQMESRKRTPTYLIGTKWIHNYSITDLTHIIEFMRQLFVLYAYPRAPVNTIGSYHEEDVVFKSKQFRESAQKLLAKMWSDKDTFIVNYLGLIETTLTADSSDGVLVSLASGYLFELVSLGPSSLASAFDAKLAWMKDLIRSSKVETRKSIAHTLGILSTASLSVPDKKSRYLELIQGFSMTAEDESKNTVDARHGAILTLGYLIGRYMYRYTGSDQVSIDSTIFSHAVIIISNGLQSDLPLISLAACEALGEIGRYAPLPIDEKNAWPTLPGIVEKICQLVKSSKDNKYREQAVFSLSQLVLSSLSLHDSVVEFIFTLPMMLSKAIEVQFVIGEALTSLMVGFSSTQMGQFLDIAESNYIAKDYDPVVAEKILVKIMDLLRPEAATSSRKASCVWLLCVVKYAGHLSFVQKHIVNLQRSFSSLLSDNDEFVQDVASKGIGLIYELGDSSVKADLVQSLVSTFTEGKKIEAQSLTGETELFGGAIATAPDGSNISNYQSILSLAADMNQPELVYRFMSLASHHAIWNSKRGASMGFNSIAAQAQELLKPFLPKLIPKLYRYQFDPNPKVSASMKNIWGSLVKESKKTVDQYFDVIVKDLLQSLGDRLWRVRESSCLAVTDVLLGRLMSEVEPYLKELWIMCFRVLDDIKESVRKAAFVTCKTLINFTVRFCDPENTGRKNAQPIMDEMIPFLLKKGLPSPVEEVRKFSLVTVLQLSKKGGVLLKPHIANIAEALLESMSSLEPQFLNYLTFHAEKYNISASQLDSSRLAAAGTSPIMEAIEACIPQMDETVMKDFVPKLCSVIRSGVGLPTRAGCARSIYFLVLRVPTYLRPHADTVLKALSGAIYDKSAVVRKAFMTATGHIAKLASEEALLRFIKHVKKGYFEATDDSMKEYAPLIFREISRSSSDVFKQYHPEILPIAYAGMFDPIEVNSTVWKDVWDENTAGAAGAAKLWSKEILTLCEELLKASPSWPIKRQIGKSIGGLAGSLKNDFTPFMSRSIPLLLDGLYGRTWDGKEAVLEALMLCCAHCSDWFLPTAQGYQHAKTVEDVFIREAKKNNQTYRRVSIEYMGKAFDSMKIDRFAEVEEYLTDVATTNDTSSMEVEERREKPLLLAIQANAYKSLGLCFPFSSTSQITTVVRVLGFLAKGLNENVWNIKVAILNALDSIFHKIDVAVISELGEEFRVTFYAALLAILVSAGDVKFSVVREHSIQLLKYILSRKEMREIIVSKPIWTANVLDTLNTLIGQETSTPLIEALKDCVALVSKMDE